MAMALDARRCSLVDKSLLAAGGTDTLIRLQVFREPREEGTHVLKREAGAASGEQQTEPFTNRALALVCASERRRSSERAHETGDKKRGSSAS
eukprot:scaffold7513_cov31-Tisochrysis_lutea.AAC.2